jgi:23S rRNA (adenine2503-C2)-methyltransferase
MENATPHPPTHLLDCSREALAAWMTERDLAAYRADQVLRWVYQRQADSFETMSDLKADLRRRLAEHFSLARPAVARRLASRDGSVKYLFRLADGRHVETVLIPEKDHDTLCISSQVGCAQGCRFCLTARGGLQRDLSAGEIVAQVREVLRDSPDPRRLSNIVLMGMGEPLANYQAVVAALRCITDGDWGLKFSGRHVTLSTAGLVPMMAPLVRDTRVNLAVSLNATDEETRSRLMPINRRYPLALLLETCRRLPLPPRRRITFEYILMAGVNDSPEEAQRLARLLRTIRAKINLIPFNPHPGSPFARPAEEAVEVFRQVLFDRGYTVVTRHSKGQDIGAACGQLSAEGGTEEGE